MKKLVKAAVMAAALLAADHAKASLTVVDFEGIHDSDLVDGYGGISGWFVLGGLRDNRIYPNPQPEIGQYHLSIGLMGADLSFDAAPVVFEGMYYNPVGLNSQISYELYFHEQLVYSAAFDPNQPVSMEMYWLTSGYQGLVDKIHIYGASDGVNIDNLTYSTVAAVPLPSAVWLFGSGLAGLTLRPPRNRKH